jgi:hypothetical protein
VHPIFVWEQIHAEDIAFQPAAIVKSSIPPVLFPIQGIEKAPADWMLIFPDNCGLVSLI